MLGSNAVTIRDGLYGPRRCHFVPVSVDHNLHTRIMRPNKTRKYVTPLAIVAGILIVGALSYLIVESRTVKDEYYVAHADRTRTIETIETDISTTIEALESAYSSGRDIPLSTQAAFARLSSNDARLQSLVDLPGSHIATPALFDGFSDELHQLLANASAFTEKQNAMAGALQALQDEAPILVRELREGGQFDQSQLVFALAIDLIEFATDEDRAKAKPLNDRIEQLRVELAESQSGTSGRIQTFVGAAAGIVREHTAAEMSLTATLESTATSHLTAVAEAISNANEETVYRAELARSLLAVCAVLLLLGAAFAFVRLQASYREINRSNAQLEEANSKLEERVAARTELLTKANNELKESQSQLIHAEKMSSLGQMVAGISHEINTPLWYLTNNSSVIQERLELVGELCKVAKMMTTAVKSRIAVRESIQQGLADMFRLLDDGIEEDIEEAQNLIKDSLFGLEELTSLAQGLKDFSRLDRAVQGQFDVNDGLDKALLIASNRVKNRIEVHKYYGDLPLISCSPSQINQIFLNLITNAADAITDRGDIVIRTWQENGNVGISISDSGVGIPEDVLPNIRDPFFTTKEVGKGTGLGLSIVDQIVTKHAGHFRIESEAGEGTCVTIILPISEHDSKVIDMESSDTELPQLDVAAMAAAESAGDLPNVAPRLLSA